MAARAIHLQNFYKRLSNQRSDELCYFYVSLHRYTEYENTVEKSPGKGVPKGAPFFA